MYMKFFRAGVALHAREVASPSTSSVSFFSRMEPFNLLWLEEPIPAENVDALRQVRARSRTPICVGENLYMRWGFRELLQQQAADVMMPDVPKCGGLAESKKIANLAEVYYLPFAPHLVSTPLGTMATCPRLRGRPQFPRPRMACARGARGLGQLRVRPRRLGLDRQGWAHRPARQARHRGRTGYGECAQARRARLRRLRVERATRKARPWPRLKGGCKRSWASASCSRAAAARSAERRSLSRRARPQGPEPRLRAARCAGRQHD